MKKAFHFLPFIIVFILLGLLAFASFPYPQSLKNMMQSRWLEIVTRKLLEYTGDEAAQLDHYRVQQGACTDGEYAYTILQSKQTDQCSLWKFRLKDWSLVDCAYHMPLDHGNDLCYNSRSNMLVAVHGSHFPQRVSFIRPDTLEILSSMDLPFPVYCIAYDSASDRYAVGIGKSYDLAILDADFQEIAVYPGQDTGLIKQGMDCDDQYIYMLQYSPKNEQHDTSSSVLQVYDWEGHFIRAIPISARIESESLFHTNERLYITFNYHAGHIYQGFLAP